jgi:hypothetical protein
VFNIHQNDPQHNVARTLLPALMIQEHGTTFYTFAPAGSSKMLACVDMWPGSGLDRKMRRDAIKFHDCCQVCVHADIHDPAGELPGPADFHAPTLLWAIKNSSQLAVWSERGSSRQADVVGWMVNTAAEGSRFQTTICTTPERAAHWLAFVDRRKGAEAEVRVFGPEGQQ